MVLTARKGPLHVFLWEGTRLSRSLSLLARTAVCLSCFSCPRSHARTHPTMALQVWIWQPPAARSRLPTLDLRRQHLRQQSLVSLRSCSPYEAACRNRRQWGTVERACAALPGRATSSIGLRSGFSSRCNPAGSAPWRPACAPSPLRRASCRPCSPAAGSGSSRECTAAVAL